MNLISPTEAFKMLEAGTAYGVDVREKSEWDAGHIDGIELNSLSEFSLESLKTDKPIIFICRSGNRSGQVCDALSPTGMSILNLEGGMKAWHAAGLPMVADSGDPQVD
ncbi:MAG: hypothetical protein RIT32_638 [Actinomycetota bacterium]|jgi:rhodanese-related sulfurtransferase